jgi:autotransporter-associated beta strand protein
MGFPMIAGANTITWANTGTDWATGGNWVDGIAPTNDTMTDTAVLPAATTIKSPLISGTVSAAGLSLDNSQAVYGAINGTLNLGAAGLTVTGAVPYTLGTNVVLAADQTWDIGGGSTVTTTRALKSLSGGSYNLIKSGAGTLSLAVSAAGGRHGTNTINAGTLSAVGYSLGDGLTTVNNNAALNLVGSIDGGSLPQFVLNDTATFSAVKGTILAPQIGSGADVNIQISSTATDLLSVSNNYITGGGNGSTITLSGAGAIYFSAGAVAAGTTAYVGSWTINSGTVKTLWGRSTFGDAGNTIYFNGGTIATVHGSGITGDAIGQAMVVGGNATVQSDSNGAATPTGNFTFGTLSIGSHTLTANINPNNVNLTSGNSNLIFGATTLTGDATFNVVNPTYNGGANTMTLDLGTVSGVGESLTKTGTGILRLSGTAHTYSGDTTVSAGTLALKVGGSIANSPAINIASGATLDLSALKTSFTIGAGHTLSGGGTVLQNLSDNNGKVLVDNGKLAGSLVLNGTVAGAGSIDPGNSPGILTADQVNPAGGLAFNFEFTAGAPTYGSPTASGNDLLRLTDAASPFTANLTAANDVNVYFDVANLSSSSDYLGGFFTDQSGDFLSSIGSATFTYYLSDPAGAFTYNGVNYDLLDPSSVSLSTTAATADFGAGPVNGQIADFAVAVPEPASLALLGVGSLALLIRQRRRAVRGGGFTTETRRTRRRKRNEPQMNTDGHGSNSCIE